jgi:hypothetical protein
MVEDGWECTGEPSSCTPLPAACEVSPTSLDFGTIALASHLDKTFTITNTGGGTLDGNVSEACAHHSIVSGGGAYSLGAGELAEVTVRFAPESPGQHDCTIETGSTLCSDVSCTGTGVVGDCFCGDIDMSGGLIDLNDFATFALCFGLFQPAPGCNAQGFFCSDVDGDLGVDLADFATFALWFGVVPDQYVPHCGQQPGCLCGDTDQNGERCELADTSTFNACYGLSAPSPPECDADAFFCSDMDGNGIVDLSDFSTFSWYCGELPPGEHWVPNCMPE